VKAQAASTIIFALLCFGLSPGKSGAKPPRFLSGPDAGVAREIGERHLRARSGELGLRRGDLDGAAERSFVDRRTGTTHLNLRQRVGGRDVFGGDVGLAIDRRGRVYARWSRAVSDAAARTNTSEPVLSARQALSRAAELLDLTAGGTNPVLRRPGGPDRQIVFAGGSLSSREIPARLTYVPQEESLRLAWDLVIRTWNGRHWWHVHIDAVTGELLQQSDWVKRETYRVYPLPTGNPSEGPRVLETGSPDPVASPFGWHDTNGVPGAEFTDTRGNNVFAQEDADGNDTGGFRPNGGSGLEFDFPLDLSQQPSTYQSAAITNLFYWNNRAHDIFYRLGFDEASGNFQENNYGNGGAALDPVSADALDGGGSNNAQFATPPDGIPPEMEMFLWTGITQLEVTSPPGIAGFYLAGPAVFGPGLTPSGTSGNIVQAEDGVGTSSDACEALTNGVAIAGNVALVDRGICNFTVKVKNAQNAGAIATVVVNNAGNGIVTMGGTDATITIPSLFIGQADGATIAAELTGGVSGTLSSGLARSGSLDGGIVIHEYAHGVTNRLTGGAATSSCLNANQSGSMGEGWSDYFGLAFTGSPTDLPEDPRGIATYLLGQSSSGAGIRTHPYSTDLAINDLTLTDIATQTIPHGAGEVWSVMLWESYWNFVNAYGFDPDLTTGTGGNNRHMQLVVDGLKNQPCNPTFVEARDAILQAEMAATGGADACFLWKGFAKRGMGDGAVVSSNPSLMTSTESFALPTECAAFCADGTQQPPEECDDGNRLDLDGCASTCETEFVQLFSGIASGGSIDLVIEGTALSVPTTAGQTASQVASAVAAAINANPTLSSLGVVAQAVDSEVVTTGSIDSIVIADSGLNPQVPLGPGVPILLALAFAASGLARLRRH